MSFDIKNKTLEVSVLEIAKKIPFAKFTGRVSYEVYNVFHSDKEPHDIDILVNDLSRLDGICEKETRTNPSTGEKEYSYKLEISTGVLVDIYEMSAWEKETNVSKKVKIKGVEILVAHPFYATNFKVGYLQGFNILNAVLKPKAKARYKKHKSHVEKYREWSKNDKSNLPHKQMLNGDFVFSDDDYFPF